MSTRAARRGPRVVVVTGASSGIGLATALLAADQGDHVVLLARDAGALQLAAERCRDRGAASARALPTDVGDGAAVARAFAAVEAALGVPDVVVNSAGLVAYGRVEDVPAELFDAVLRTNVAGTANVARAVLPGMRRRGTGTLVLVGSLLGYIAAPYMSAYPVSKWAVRALVRELQLENRDRPGVHVCEVAPGGVDTPIYLQAANFLGPVGRPPPPVVTPEQVARAALRLADRPRPRVQVGPANRFTILGFTLLPGLYDRLVTPLFEVAALDQRRRKAPGPGNVLDPAPEGNRLHGGQGSPLASILAGVRTQARRARRRPQRVRRPGGGAEEG